MSDVFGIDLSALQAFQQAIAVTSNNVANASTPGYDEGIHSTVGGGAAIHRRRPDRRRGRRRREYPAPISQAARIS